MSFESKITPAVVDVLEERRRQVDVEGWTPEHDDQHVNGELATAAACYAGYSAATISLREIQTLWPWGWNWWKPRDTRRDLVRAAALLIAEIERLDRVGTIRP